MCMKKIRKILGGKLFLFPFETGTGVAKRPIPEYTIEIFMTELSALHVSAYVLIDTHLRDPLPHFTVFG